MFLPVILVLSSLLSAPVFVKSRLLSLDVIMVLEQLSTWLNSLVMNVILSSGEGHKTSAVRSQSTGAGEYQGLHGGLERRRGGNYPEESQIKVDNSEHHIQ